MVGANLLKPKKWMNTHHGENLLVPESVANGDRILRDNAKKPLGVALHLIHPVPLRQSTTVINGSSYMIQSICDH